jgi:predicted signal transduction protein with EAL and GGDEF domain
VVAEGVELPAQLGRLRALGCQFAQGFYFARPMDPASIEAILAHGGILRDPADSGAGSGAGQEPTASSAAA